jgi:hypothetical protein
MRCLRRLAICVVLLPFAQSALAATILQRTVDVSIEEEAYIVTESLRVKLDDPGDGETWSEYDIWLNEHIELVDCTARVLDEKGKRLASVPRRRHRRIESVGFGLYTTQWVSSVPFPPLYPGQQLEIRTTTRHQPYFKTHTIALTEPSPQERLEIHVRGGGDELRWRVDGQEAWFEVSPVKAGFDLKASGLPGYGSRRLEWGDEPMATVLRISWDQATVWPEVGRWYVDLLSELPDTDGGIAGLAARVTAGAGSRREQVEALAQYVKRTIRYEAVEIGVGGWLPTAPAEVVKRGWGDCKDKSKLLSDLLTAVNIPSHLFLLRSGLNGRIDRDHPTPFQFNHCIVGVVASAAGASEDDPVRDGILFIDPTSEWGAVAWLTPYVQDRFGLLVNGAESRLVRTPRIPEQERRELTVEGQVDESGSLEAAVRYRLAGSFAVPWLQDLASRARERTDEDFRSLMGAIVPGVVLGNIRWEKLHGPIPALELKADLLLSDAFRTRSKGHFFRAASLGGFPDSRRIIEDRRALTARAGARLTRWSLQLPKTWCPIEPVDEAVENDVGRFRRQVSRGEEGELLIEYAAVLQQSRIEAHQFEQLAALAAAEAKATKRSVRLRCP